MDENLNLEAREFVAALRLPGGRQHTTESDLGWALRADAEAIMMHLARYPESYPGPIDRALQMAATRLARGGMALFMDHPGVSALATWYAKQLLGVLLERCGHKPIQEPRSTDERDIILRTWLEHGDVTTPLAFEPDGMITVSPLIDIDERLCPPRPK